MTERTFTLTSEQAKEQDAATISVIPEILEEHFSGETFILFFDNFKPGRKGELGQGVWLCIWSLTGIRHELVPYQPFDQNLERYDPELTIWSLVADTRESYRLSDDIDLFDPRGSIRERAKEERTADEPDDDEATEETMEEANEQRR